MREFSALPVIFLTSKDDEVDQVLGLRMGADDYITKPFSQRLLLIERIRVLLRRQDRCAPSKSAKTGRVRTVILFMRQLRVWMRPGMCAPGRKGREVDLTVTEYLLVKALAIRGPGTSRTSDQLIDMAYGENIYVDDRTIDSHIKRIRKKFRVIDNEFSQIETLYGVGYKYKEE
jgi:two-component system response regulator ChvI